MTHFSIELGHFELEQLREAAKSLGLVSSTGPYTNQGSIRQLMQAIAHGKVTLAVNPDCQPIPEPGKVCW
jgi:hypothetical protein